MTSSTIYVRNIPPVISEDELSSLFEAYGRVLSARVIGDNDSGKTHGYGFVEMASEESAQNAVESLNGAELEGRDLQVEIAKGRRGSSRRRSF